VGDTVRLVENRAREYVLADSGAQLPERVRDELAMVFSVEEDRRAARLGRTWLDTFDWRLHRAGLTLQHVSTRGTRGTDELVLTGRGGQRLTAPARLARWPSLAAALPPGPLRDRVAAAAGLRALLPTVSVISQVREVRLRNEDDKTVVRILLDAMSPSAPGGAPIPARLAVTEVRGYAAPARRAGRLLTVAGASLTRQTALDAALSAAGRHPRDYTGKVDVALRPAMPGGEALRAILLQQLDNLEANVDGVLHDTDTEFLHDLRIAVRRTRSGLKLLGDVLPGDLTLRFASEFRWLGDQTTPLRDLDVHLLSLPPMAEHLVAADPLDLQPFLAYLGRRRTVERRRLNRALRSARFAATVGDWRKALLVPPGNRRAPAGPPAAELAADRTRRAHGRVIKLGSAITGSSPPESLHTLRKRCKELRYVLEFFASLHDPPAYRAVLGDLKRLQDCLGDFQDSQVQREEIQSLAAAMLAQQAAPASTLLAMGELAAQLAVQQGQARAEFAARFAGFAGTEGRRRMAALTAGETA
jgi:CHAD domain-containing protein